VNQITNELMPADPKQATDYQLIKMENESMMMAASVRPRNNQAVMRELLDQMEAYPSFAESVMYAKPIGKDQRGQMQYARGLSIRAAEAIAAAWGYNRIEQTVEPIDEDRVRVTATFTDFQSGRIWRDSGIVSKWYKDRFGKMTKHNDERFFNVVIKAELSKRVREAVMRSVPPGVRSELQVIAERMIARLLGNDTIQKIVDSFASIGVTLVQLENLLDKPVKMGWTTEDRVTLQQVFTAIRDGETTVGEAFARQPDEPVKVTTQATGLNDALKEVVG
jgi:hypothetical protein